jgi:tRNA G18 (ribose-2'-O)-methylase SpoU
MYNNSMSEMQIGVGPHEKPWPSGKQYDKELLEHGDTRNVLDRYRYWTVEAIKADLDTARNDVHIAIENWQHDMNIGTIVRNANAFNVAAVHIIGKRHWNKRGAMVTDAYMHVFHHATVADFVLAMGDRHIVAVENLPGSVPLSSVGLPERAVLVFGGEGPGLSDDMVKASEMMVAIEQFGSTRSVNVGVASGVALYMWTLQHVLKR